MTITNTVQKSLVALAALVAIGAGAGVAGLASAQTAGGAGMRPGGGITGTVTAITGNTLTVSGKNSTVYTVNASGAKVLKSTAGAAPATASLSDIKVGDTVGVRGTVSGTSVTATAVMDGVIPHQGPRGGMRGKGPGVMGKVTAVNGNTVTITNADGTAYTIDASAAKISKTSDISVGDIRVGDTLGVMGTVNGTSVKAAHIMDGVPPTPQAPPANR